jgi:hypothetical protein
VTGPLELPRHLALWTNQHEFGANPAQTRATDRASVSAEGGGTATPTLGGGYGFSRELEPATGTAEGNRL